MESPNLGRATSVSLLLTDGIEPLGSKSVPVLDGLLWIVDADLRLVQCFDLD